MIYKAVTKHKILGRLVAQVAASVAPDRAALATRNVVTLVDKSYPNIVDPKAPNDGRLKVGGAIRARSLGEARDNSFILPIPKGIVVGTDRICF